MACFFLLLQTQRLAIEIQQTESEMPMFLSGDSSNRGIPSSERSLMFSPLRDQHFMSDEELARELQLQEDMLASRFSRSSSYLDTNVEYDNS